MKKKTILYIGGFELPDKNAAAQRVTANAKILRALGYAIVFIGVDKTIKTKVPLLATEKSFEGFTYYSVKYPISIIEWYDYLTSINNILTLKLIFPSHIIAYNYPAFALMRLKKYCHTQNIFLIADCTEWDEPIGHLGYKILKGLDIYLRMHLVHSNINGLIVISEYLENFYSKKIKNLVQLPPLVDLSMNKWTFSDNLTGDKRIILVYAGTPGGGEKDRIDTIINALSEIKKSSILQFNFNIVGLTQSDYIKSFGNENLPPNINEFVCFKGRLSHIDTLKEINKADYQIFIRNKNLKNMAGFPTKYVESISCGTPVLTNSSSNIEQYFRLEETGFLLDISSAEVLEKDLKAALFLSKDAINKMKDYCKSSHMFNYENYVTLFGEFLTNVAENGKYQAS